MLRHNIDVMHVEKNISNLFLRTLLYNKGKTREFFNARRELMRMKTKKMLHPIHKCDNRYELPPICYTLTLAERSHFIDVLKRIKETDGYASNIFGIVKNRKIPRLKNHDSHMLINQSLLSL